MILLDRNYCPHTSCRTKYPLALGLTWFWMMPCAASGADMDLASAKAAHASSLKSIYTFSCVANSKFEPPQLDGRISGRVTKYYRKGGMVRCTTRTLPKGGVFTGKNDVLIKDGVRSAANSRRYPKSDSPESHGVILAADMPLQGDVWSAALFSFFGETKFRVSLEELLDDEPEIHTAEMTELDGEPVFLIDLEHKRARIKIWLSPAHRFLAKRVSMKGNDGSVGDFRVVEFVEPSAGIMFPAQVRMVSNPGTPNLSTASTRFSNIEINKPLPASVFKFRFPRGITVLDKIRGGVFIADASGRPTLPARSKSGNRYQLGKGPPREALDAAAPYDGRPTQVEPSATWRWWLLGVSVLILIAAGVLIYRRRRDEGQE